MKIKFLFAISFLIALFPVLGFPNTWEMYAQIILGIIGMLLSYLLGKQIHAGSHDADSHTDSYVENTRTEKQYPQAHLEKESIT